MKKCNQIKATRIDTESETNFVIVNDCGKQCNRNGMHYFNCTLIINETEF